MLSFDPALTLASATLRKTAMMSPTHSAMMASSLSLSVPLLRRSFATACVTPFTTTKPVAIAAPPAISRSLRSSSPLISRPTRNSFSMSSIRQTAGPRRPMATHTRPQHYEAIVVGAGPGGVTCLGNLLERRVSPILWVDADGFNGGRMNAKYREVPSNTKVGLFIDFATALAPFRKIVSGAPSRSQWEEPSDSDSVNTGNPDKLHELRALQQDKGCQLSYAADMTLMLTEGLKKTPGVVAQTARMTDATLDESASEWTVRLDSQESSATTATAKRIVLCTGATPNNSPLPVDVPGIQRMDLDTALSPTRLHHALSSSGPPTGLTTVAVIGASHSAILVLMNLYQLASSTKPDLRIRWFTRHPLRYAEYMDGWILRDNTGLKGEAAAWAKANLEPETFAQSDVKKYIEPIPYDAGAEHDAFNEHMPGCDFFIQAIGYDRSPIPTFRTAAGRTIEPQYNHETGGFIYLQESEDGHVATQSKVPGVYGAGIAFPERVKDPRGNTEYAVGFWKFMKYVKRVSPEWN